TVCTGWSNVREVPLMLSCTAVPGASATLLPVFLHRVSKEGDLALEARARDQDGKVQAQHEALPCRQRGLLPPGHETGRILAGDDVADGFADHGGFGRLVSV